MNTHQIRENIRLFTKTHTILLVLILLSFTFKNYNLTYILGVCFLANCVSQTFIFDFTKNMVNKYGQQIALID